MAAMSSHFHWGKKQSILTYLAGKSRYVRKKKEKNPNIENKKHTKQNKNHLEIPE